MFARPFIDTAKNVKRNQAGHHGGIEGGHNRQEWEEESYRFGVVAGGKMLLVSSLDRFFSLFTDEITIYSALTIYAGRR